MEVFDGSLRGDLSLQWQLNIVQHWVVLGAREQAGQQVDLDQDDVIVTYGERQVHSWVANHMTIS